MAYCLILKISGLPKRTNNLKGPWQVRMMEARKWKSRVLFEVGNRRPKTALTKAKITLTRHSSSEPDYDGLVSSFKHLLDGLILAKVIENDKMSNIGVPVYLWEKTKKGKGYITIKVEGE